MTDLRASLGSITNIASAREENRAVERFYYQSIARDLLPDHRVRICLRNRLPGREFVEIFHSKNAARAHYEGLMVCGSVWICPVCSSRISETRRLELTTALANSRDRFVPLLLTYTIRHNVTQPLDDLLTAMLAAFRKLRSGRAWQTVKNEYLLVGSVRATEFTYGDNGWHPHFHELMILDVEILKSEPNIDLIADSLKRQLAERWIDVLHTVGLDADFEHGVKASSTYGDVEDYVIKFGRLPAHQESRWTVEHELTKAVVKSAGRNGRSPFELLRDFGDGDEQAGELFKDYAAATFRKAQLNWSRGLKALLGIDEVTDDQILDESETDQTLLAALDARQWRFVLDADAQGYILQIAHEGKPGKLYAALDALEGMETARHSYGQVATS